GPLALRMAKLALNPSSHAPEYAGLLIETLAQTVCFGSKDKAEGTLAFLEKRKPEFHGKGAGIFAGNFYLGCVHLTRASRESRERIGLHAAGMSGAKMGFVEALESLAEWARELHSSRTGVAPVSRSMGFSTKRPLVSGLSYHLFRSKY